MSYRVSLLIPTKDRLFLIRSCLESLLETVNFSDVEIILGDTGSRDASVFRLYDEVGRRFRGGFRVERLAKYHFSRNNNAMAARARGTNLVFLNNDTVALPGWLEALLEPLARPGVAVTGAKLLYAHNDRVQHAGLEFLREGPWKYLGYHPYKDRRPEMPEIADDRYVPAVTGACLAMGRDLFEAVGGFDEAYREEAQDVDLCLKAQGKKGRCYLASRAVLYHLENGTRSLSESPEDRQLVTRRWKETIEERFFRTKFQSEPVDPALARWRKKARYALFLRPEARGDVFAATCLAKAYREKNPDTHVTFKTNHPDLVDGLPFVDRALGLAEPDDFPYDDFFKLTYEDGTWRDRPHTWIEEMANGLGLAPLKDYRPVYAFSPLDEPVRRYYREWSERSPFVVIATGAGWPEREWASGRWEELVRGILGMGLAVVQVGGGGDFRVRGIPHLLDRSLHENLAVVSSARAMVTVDSFPYHLGVAVGLPVVLLTCKTCAHTVYTPSQVVEVRNWEAGATPLPGCRFLGCREKAGVGAGYPCATPILKDLPADRVLAALQIQLGNQRAKGGWSGIPAHLA